MTENDKCETDTFYGASKVAQTYLATAYAKEFKKNIKIVRPSSIYGPGEANFRFIPTIINSIKVKPFCKFFVMVRISTLSFIKK